MPVATHGHEPSPTRVKQLAYSTRKHLLNQVVPRIMDENLGKSLKRSSRQFNAVLDKYKLNCHAST
jgi:hypothetical protein